jgi:TonB family protein
MYFDQKGPLIFSASIHFAVVIFFVIKSMVNPEKPPEELIFILSAPPPLSSATEQEDSTISYDEEEFVMPDIPDLPPVIPEEPEPEPPVEREPELVIPLEEKPKPKATSYAEYIKENKIPDQKIPKPRAPKRIDLSDLVDRLKNNLPQPSDISMPSTDWNELSNVNQDQLSRYFAALKQAILQAIESHPMTAKSLKTKVQFYLAPNGAISGAVIVSGSGDAAFDQKVIAGFRRLKRHGRPPGLTGTEYLTMTINQIN